MVYRQYGGLVTNIEQINNSNSWDTQTEWDAFQNKRNVNVENGALMLSETQTIPPNAVHLWEFAEGMRLTTIDIVTDSDATIQEPNSWLYGDYVGGVSIQDSPVTATPFNLDNSNDWSISFTFSTTGSDILLGMDNGTAGRLFLTTGSEFTAEPNRMNLHMWNSGNIDVHTDMDVNDGVLRRYTVQKITNDPTNWEIWVDGSNAPTSMNSNDNITFPSFGNTIFLQEVGGIIDNIIVRNDTLTSTEIQNDYNNQPWV